MIVVKVCEECGGRLIINDSQFVCEVCGLVSDLIPENFLDMRNPRSRERGDDGFIASGNLYDVRDDIVWLDFYEIDLRKYLNTFTDEKLKELAELAFWNWDKSCRIIDTEKVEKFIREVRSVK